MVLMANTLVQNTAANVVTKIWTIFSLYLFVPIWIHFLGVEGYGVISFYTILMTLMFFADAGLTATLTREFARGDKDEQYRRDLLRTIELIYLVIASILFAAIFLFSGVIVDLFLKSNSFTHEELLLCVRLMGLSMAIHFMFSLYSGGLFGLQKQVLANVINILYSVSRSAIVVIPLLIYPTVLTFFVWQLVSISIALIVVRYYLIKCITTMNSQSVFRKEYLQSIWKFAFGMMLMSIISALNTQLDKLIIGNVLSLQDMGYYSLASTIGIAVISISQPLGVAFYPEFTRLLSCNKKKMEKLFLLFTYVVSSISVAIGMTLFFYVDEFSYLWTYDHSIVEAVRVPARLLIIGNILQSLQLAPYYLALANGHTKTNVKLGIFMLMFMIPAVYFFTKELGLKGTAIPYVIINIIATLYLSIVIISRFFRDILLTWLKFVLQPICLVLLIVTIPFFLFQYAIIGNNYFIVLCMGSTTGILGLYISILFLFRNNQDLIGCLPVNIRKYFFFNKYNYEK